MSQRRTRGDDATESFSSSALFSSPIVVVAPAVDMIARMARGKVGDVMVCWWSRRVSMADVEYQYQ